MIKPPNHPKPHMRNGRLVIPFGSRERYHWWKPNARLTISQVREEFGFPKLAPIGADREPSCAP